jgi:outer membrane usher protein
VITGAFNRPAKIEYPENTSGFLNYAVNVRDFKSINAFSEVGVTLNNTHLYTGVSRNADGSIVRGLSNVTVSNRKNSNRFIVGDRLVNSDILGGSITLGGLSYFRDFALDPYMVRNPGLHYEGAVSTPSTLDVYSNGQLVRRVPLPPGQFQVNDLPVPSGSNNTRYVIRDAFGRERELGSANFYFSSGLLTPGLHDFGYNIGTRREDMGDKNWGYDMPLFLGHHRYGFTEYLTGGMRFEAAKGLVSGGPSVSFLLPIGEMELVGAASTEHGKSGGGAFAGFNYVNQLFSFGTSVKYQSQRYANTSLDATDSRPWLETGSYVTYYIPGGMSINLRYAFENSQSQGPLHRIRTFTSTYLTKQLRLFVDGYVDVKARERTFGLNAGLNFTFDDISASVSYLNEYGKSSGLVDIRKSLPLAGMVAQATNGDLDSALQYQTSFGRYEAIYNRVDGQTRPERIRRTSRH